MRRPLALLFCLALSCLAAGPVAAQPSRAADVDREQIARSFVGQLSAGDFAAAAERLGGPLAVSMPPSELEWLWTGLVSTRGPFRRIVGSRTTTSEQYGGQTYNIVLVQCELGQSLLNVRMSFDRTARITSLWFHPSERAAN